MKTIKRNYNALLVSFLMMTSTAFANTPTSTKSNDQKDHAEKMEKARNAERDNTAVNARDEKALTADEQAYGSDRDVEITRKIRQEIVGIKDLSTYGQNVKIITIGGKVFLRGPVRSADEKSQITARAEKIAGAQNVKDELEVVRK